MQKKQLHVTDSGQRTIAVVLDAGDEFVASLERVADDERVTAASFTAIGAFERATLGYFHWEAKAYRDINVDEQTEIASLVGNVARKTDGAVKVHAHVVLGTSDGHALAGHVRSGTVRPTVELVLEESPAFLERRQDDDTGLALLRLETVARPR